MKKQFRKKTGKGGGHIAKVTARIDIARELRRSAHKDGGREKHAPKREPGEVLKLTVRGLVHGSVRMEAADGREFLCRKDDAHGTLWGDTVQAERIGGERVVVRKVLTRAHEQISGVLGMHRREWVLAPIERRLPQSIAVDSVDCDAGEGDIVRAHVLQWDDEGGMMVRIEERIGSFDQATCALDGLVASAHLHTKFGEDVLREADACKPADLADDPTREDARGLLSFTIDGRDAKDFDDAVSLTREGDLWRLGVHIADVGHYVAQGSALDKEAYARGTSVYLPGRVLPMLPEQLSNGVCSLRPDEDKFTMSIFMDIDERGETVSARLARTITRSKARLVYDDVNALFAGDEVQAEKMAAVRDTLRDMRGLSKKLRARREAMGCIDFDTEEPVFVLDEDGEPVEIIKRERGDAELMIEDFMLAANEAVARMARERGLPLLYRVHEKPDPEKLGTFADFLRGLGIDARGIGPNARPGDIRAVLESTKDRPEYPVISTLALRSMQKARYDAKPLGHYGLAMDDYCHFTSPIRRYPDLVVSRALTAMLKGERVSMMGDRLGDAAVQSSDRERVAVDAERAADKLMMARYMDRHVGEDFDGTISGVTDWGVYVMMENGAEGFVHVRTMDDWFDFDERRMTLRGERSGVVLSLGMHVRVHVESVELAQSAVDLSLVHISGLKKPMREKSERKRERERLRGFRR